MTSHTRALRTTILTALCINIFGCSSHKIASVPAAPPLASEQWQTGALEFGSHVWHTRAGAHRAGPGNNFWSNAAPHVSVDPTGRLHLQVAADNEQKLRAAEIATDLPPGPCRIVVDVDSSLMGMDPNVVVGVFVYRNDQSEFDFEASRWGQPEAHDGLFTVAATSPEKKRRHQRAFALPPGPTRIALEWRAESVQFSLYSLTDESRPLAIATWGYRGKEMPQLGGHRLHLNVWHRGAAQEGAQARVERAEIIVKRIQIETL
jgi:hypothetical protein